jgi:pyruvate dehydrogenase E2 component (dihydrolipoamide acetyltransferase)
MEAPLAETRDVLVPDIGDFADVPVIEVLVSPGDSVAPEDPLVTLESDKATMDVPAPFGGTVAEIRVSVGDTVSEGSPILTLQVQTNGASAPITSCARAAVDRSANCSARAIASWASATASSPPAP